ncbi:hypothetical protein EDB81DRAFT_774436 [Dactylonectria macrodidyma]|uniref:Secreted protein n=1 Tax=Dactylonectria macrodidyma TaxID=307937 RepID=A0A9P9FQT2_9HYPO|nr:hypothetical protein EDB81DRAFT_774436 [Dactylonectria macrodidyma]
MATVVASRMALAMISLTSSFTVRFNGESARITAHTLQSPSDSSSRCSSPTPSSQSEVTVIGENACAVAHQRGLVHCRRSRKGILNGVSSGGPWPKTWRKCQAHTLVVLLVDCRETHTVPKLYDE